MLAGVRRRHLTAEVRLALQATAAAAARRDPRDDDVVADGQVRHAGADLDDLAGALVTEHHGRVGREHAVDHRQVGVAHAGGADAHLDLAVTRIDGLGVGHDVELFVAEPAQHGSTHGFPFRVAWLLGHENRF